MRDTIFRRKVAEALDELPTWASMETQQLEALEALDLVSPRGIVAVATDDHYPDQLQAFALWLIARVLRRETALPVLASVLKSGTHWTVRAEAAQGLAWIGGYTASQLLVDAVREARDTRLRTQIVNAIGFAGERRAFRALIEVLGEVRHPNVVRAAGAEALGHLLAGGRRRPQAIEALRQGAGDPSPEVRFWSVFALGEIGDRRELPFLNEIASVDTGVAKKWGSVAAEATQAAESIRRRSSERARRL
jgi:HEAT repeat protein